MRFQLGDVATWVSSLITGGLFGVSLFQLGQLRRDREADQAKQVSAWISASKVGYNGDDEDPSVTVEVSLRNVSTQPIGRVLLEVTLGNQQSRRGIGPLTPDGTISTVSIPFPKIPLADAQAIPTLKIWFTDEAGHQWHRPRGGRLKQGTPPKDWTELRIIIAGRPQKNAKAEATVDSASETHEDQGA